MNPVRLLGALILAGASTLLWLGERPLQAASALSAWAEGRDGSVCSFRQRTGLPCAGCGGTTAFAHAARGRWREAAAANPLGAFAGGGAWVLLFASAGALGSGRASSLRWTALALGAAAPLVFVWTLITWWTSLPNGPVP